MVLRQCFEILRENQAQGTSKVRRRLSVGKERERDEVRRFLDGSVSRIEADLVLQELFRW